MKQALPWIGASVLLAALGQIALKVASRGLALAPDGSTFQFGTFLRLVRTPSMWGGLLLYGISAILWIRALATAPLGVAYPMASMGYVIVLVASSVLFGEPIGWRAVLAIVAICIGVTLLATS